MDEFAALTPEKQVRYELKRAQYNMAKKEYAELTKKFQDDGGKFSWLILFHHLCSTYGWTIDYVASLKPRQVRLLMTGAKDYHKRQQNVIKKAQEEKEDNKPNSFDGSSVKSIKKSAKTPQDFLKSGLFNIVKKKKN